MKRSNNIITILIILAVIVLAIIIITRPKSNLNEEELAKCIGEKAVLYTQLGCHLCEVQEKMFGDNIKYLNIIDCFYEREKCDNIAGTPTWEIKGKLYKGVQSIEKLKELTGC